MDTITLAPDNSLLDPFTVQPGTQVAICFTSDGVYTRLIKGTIARMDRTLYSLTYGFTDGQQVPIPIDDYNRVYIYDATTTERINYHAYPNENSTMGKKYPHPRHFVYIS